MNERTSHERLDPAAARELLDGDQGWSYLDVRTPEEFAAGHAPGAYNVPWALRGPAGMEPSPSFLEDVRRHFEPESPLVVGCAAGGRSTRACAELAAAGFRRLADLAGGFSGCPDPAGGPPTPGWQTLGFPVTREAGGRDWTALRS